MSQPQIDPQASLHIALNAAEKWRRGSNLAWENISLSSVTTNALSVAVNVHAESTAGIASLQELNCGEYLERMLECNTHLWDLLRANGPSAGAVSHNITAAHIALMMGRVELARELIKPSLDSGVLRYFPLTPFWQSYAIAFNGFVTKSLFTTPDIKLKGYEKHWMPYISLMSAIVAGTDTSACVSTIEDSFTTRNRDKRLTDWKMIDGDGNTPVKWDFRKASLTGIAQGSQCPR